MMAASAIMGGQQQAQQAAQQYAQQQWAEFSKKMQIQKQNRQIAKKNAMQWQQNKFIAQAANKSRAERDFYIRLNYKNETGEFSRNVTATNDRLLGYLNAKNVKGQTAKQLMRQSLESAQKASVNKRLNYENQLRSSERQQQANLAKRNFGYNDQIQFMPGLDMGNQSGNIMKAAIGQGILSGAMGAYGAAQTQGLMSAQAKAAESQANAMWSAAGYGAGGMGPPRF